SAPEAKYNWSVLARPIDTTSTPCATTPSANASANRGDESRMSWPITTDCAPSDRINRAKAAPNSRTSSSVSCSPTTPLMSYALTMPDRSVTRPPIPQPTAVDFRSRAYRDRALRDRVGQHAQVAATTASARRVLLLRLLGLRGLLPARLADGLGQRGQLVTRRFVGEVALVPDDLPALRSGQTHRVLGAQIVGVRLGGRGQRTDDGRGIAVGVGQRGDRGKSTPRPRAHTHGSHSR